jgi:hypothetical protein
MTNTVAQPAKCLRCGHRIWSARSVSAKYGPVCKAKIRLAVLNEAIRGFATAQVDKARELIADGGLIPTGRPGVFRAVSSNGVDTYLTSAKGPCGCAHGLRTITAKFCYHVLGARILVATGKAA